MTKYICDKCGSEEKGEAKSIQRVSISTQKIDGIAESRPCVQEKRDYCNSCIVNLCEEFKRKMDRCV